MPSIYIGRLHKQDQDEDSLAAQQILIHPADYSLVKSRSIFRHVRQIRKQISEDHLYSPAIYIDI